VSTFRLTVEDPRITRLRHLDAVDREILRAQLAAREPRAAFVERLAMQVSPIRYCPSREAR
jgi:hypothetical protein